MAMPTGEHCWKKNSGAPWARTSNLWITSLTRCPLSYLGRYVELQWRPQPISLSINFMTLIPNLTFTELRLVSMKRLQRVWHASRAHSGHLVPSHILGLVYAPIVETSFPELAVSFLDFSPSIPLGTSSILFLFFFTILIQKYYILHLFRLAS